MAARGSGGLLLCVALLLAMPALAATPADRGECAASADKADVGGAACSRIIDDANVSVADRVKAFVNRGRGAFNAKDYDRAIADYGEAIKLSPKDASAFAHRCEAYESKEDHVAAIADCTEAIRIDPKYGRAYNNRGVAYYGLHEYDAALADHAEAIKVNSGMCGPMPAAAWRGRKRVNSTRRSPISPRRSQSIRNTPLVSAKGGRHSSGRG